MVNTSIGDKKNQNSISRKIRSESKTEFIKKNKKRNNENAIFHRTVCSDSYSLHNYNFSRASLLRQFFLHD